jgi:PAS domain S-box-containing protein
MRLVAALIDNMDVGIIVLDRERVIQFWNGFVSRVSGRALQDALGAPFEQVFPEGDLECLAHLMGEVGDGEAVPRMIWVESRHLIRLGLRRGDEETLLQSALMVYCGTEAAPYYALVLFDVADALKVTEQVELALKALGEGAGRRLVRQADSINTRMLQTEKMAAIGQLAAGVAHEINNPVGYVFSNLKALGGYVQDLLRIVDAVDTAGSVAELAELKKSLDYDYIRNDVGALLSESEDGIDRVKVIIGALKDFSRADEAQPQPADLHRGIDSTLNVVNNELKYKAEVVKEYGALPEVECIPSQINQVVMNLLVNAAHAIEGFGRITLRSGHEGEWVWLEVEDTGCGMPPQRVNRIFEPFFTTKPVGKGTGLGLSLSFNIIQKHHGRIEVASRVGEGTRFRIWLPVRQPQAAGDGTAA